MSQQSEETANILHLPNEILIKILSYVPEQIKIGKTCKRFYEISCKITKCQLNIKLPDFSLEEISEDSCDLPTICYSKRRVTSLKISCKSYRKLDTIYTLLTKVLERFSDGIEELEIRNVNLTKKTIKILNLLPNLRQLSLKYVKSPKIIPVNFKLRLPKLKTIRVEFCNGEMLNVLDTLPEDILTEIHLALDPMIIQSKHFQNQRNVKIISTSSGNTKMLTFKNMKLNSLSVSDFEGVYEVLTGQNELTFLKVSKIKNQREINIIARELVSLQVLEVEEFFNKPNFSVLQFMENLQILKFSESNRLLNLRFVFSKTLQELHANNALDFFELQSDFINEVLPQNCPNLHTISFTSKYPTTIVNKILFGFPQLKRLTVRTSSTGLGNWNQRSQPQHFEHMHLKELYINNTINKYKDLDGIVTCTALETVKIDMKLDPKFLEAFFGNQPSVKFLHIKVSKVSLEFIVGIMSTLKEIVKIKLESHMSNYEHFVNLMEELKKNFPNSKLMRFNKIHLLLVVN